MLNSRQIDLLRPRLVQFRLIIGGLIGGIIMFSIVIVVVKGAAFGGQLTALSLICLSISFVLVVNALVVPVLIDRSQLAQIGHQLQSVAPEQKTNEAIDLLASAWITRTIIGASMLEGAAILNLVAVFLEGNAVHLAAAALMLSLMIVFFPTEGRVVGWIERHLAQLN